MDTTPITPPTTAAGAAGVARCWAEEDAGRLASKPGANQAWGERRDGAPDQAAGAAIRRAAEGARHSSTAHVSGLPCHRPHPRHTSSCTPLQVLQNPQVGEGQREEAGQRG